MEIILLIFVMLPPPQTEIAQFIREQNKEL